MEPKQSIPPILRPDSVTPVSLGTICEKFNFSLNEAHEEITVTGISMNTGDLRHGDLFVAMPGVKTHGANFAAKALELG
ncbi:MAG: UDP-N-acetylmuramoyl-L-alanyl-D-glutamate--2,6-diaminopimelate ligase, partial [Microbacteriaceae bacterium]|nr:UDP-N-acetylmuramoyl-L-alanyl-D-glutamate--2,6-diaminopimelate ligase [Microbacteriaceae bacterium]